LLEPDDFGLATSNLNPSLDQSRPGLSRHAGEKSIVKTTTSVVWQKLAEAAVRRGSSNASDP
jgi:hypothetical protein